MKISQNIGKPADMPMSGGQPMTLKKKVEVQSILPPVIHTERSSAT